VPEILEVGEYHPVCHLDEKIVDESQYPGKDPVDFETYREIIPGVINDSTGVVKHVFIDQCRQNGIKVKSYYVFGFVLFDSGKQPKLE
jgi:hypothetical protein